MKIGDLVVYQTLSDIMHTVGDYPRQRQIWRETGLLVEMYKAGITQVCYILDSKTGKLIKKYIPQVRKAKFHGEENGNKMSKRKTKQR